jgi:hypothetical protein
MTKAQYVLAGFIVVGFLGITVILFIPQAQEALPKWTQENMTAVFVAWITQFGTVVNYFFGSSKGSADKTKLLKPE